MKSIKVAGAIIKKDDLILIAQRKKGEFAGKWEFPGGKFEQDENGEQALIREIKEELEIDVKIDSFFTTIEHDYSSFHLSMDCYICHMLTDHIHLNDHTGIKWIKITQNDSIDWIEADKPIFDKLIKEYGNI